MATKDSYKRLSKVFGLNKDREGLVARYLNEQQNWESHIANTRKYILKAAENKDKGLGVILGSGWWLDLPFEELSNLFNKLIFIDITHPSQIIHKAKKFSNIELVNADVSGFLDFVYKKTKEKHESINMDDFIPENSRFGLNENLNPDFVVSLNLLNQLSFFPKKFLRLKKNVEEYELNQLVKNIEKYHIDSLPLNKSCLVTDYHQYEYDTRNKLLKESKRLAIDLPENSSREEWVWDFDLSGNFINNRKVRFKVAALQV